jgi:hypothetical protein
MLEARVEELEEELRKERELSTRLMVEGKEGGQGKEGLAEGKGGTASPGTWVGFEEVSPLLVTDLNGLLCRVMLRVDKASLFFPSLALARDPSRLPPSIPPNRRTVLQPCPPRHSSQHCSH